MAFKGKIKVRDCAGYTGHIIGKVEDSGELFIAVRWTETSDGIACDFVELVSPDSLSGPVLSIVEEL